MQIWPSAAIGKGTYLLVRSCAGVLMNFVDPQGTGSRLSVQSKQGSMA